MRFCFGDGFEVCRESARLVGCCPALEGREIGGRLALCYIERGPRQDLVKLGRHAFALGSCVAFALS
jgi:hypothetical protein